MASYQPVHVETIHSVKAYTTAEINYAIRLAYALGRGKLVVCIPPKHA